ncbi:MAG: methyl-accepting chemotaxis protein, partial [Alphaproteobacteria bacterium]
MAFGLFGKRVQEPAAPAVEPQPAKPAAAPEIAAGGDSDSAREILELLDLELGAMIRQLERAASSVA